MSGTPWNEKLRGVVLYDDGVQVPGSGRVGAINFLNSVLSYNIATGVATVSLNEAASLVVTPGRLLGRYTSPAGPSEEITPSGNIELTAGGVLQRGALTGAVTAAAGSGITSFRAAPALTLLGNGSGSTAGLTNITGTTDGHVPRIAAGLLAFGTIGIASLGDIPTDRLLGRDTAGTGAAEHLTVSGGVEFTGSGGIQTSAFTGDVTKPAGSTVQAFRAFAAHSVLANATTGSAVPTESTSTADHQVFRRNGTIGWGTIATDGLGPNVVTYAKFQKVAAQRLLGNPTGSLADVSEISLDATLEFSSTTLRRVAIAGDVTIATGSNTSAFRTAPARTVLANATNSTAALGNLSASGAGQVLQDTGTALTFATLAATALGDVPTDRLVGRDTAGTGAAEFIALDTTLEFTGSQVIRRAALTGAITASAGSNTTAFGAFAALTVLANATNTSAVPTAVAAGANDRLFARTSDALSFTQLTNGMVATNTIGLDKLVNIATDSLLGRDTAGTGAVENITLNATLSMTGSGALQRAALTGDVTASAGSNSTAFRSFTARSVLARSANSSGVPTELSGGGANTVLYDTGTALTFGALPSAAITPPGSTTQVFYNNAGAWDAASGVTILDSETGIKASHFDGPGTVAATGIHRYAKAAGTVAAFLAADGTTTRNLFLLSGDGTTFTDLTIGDTAGTTAANAGPNGFYLGAYDFVQLRTRAGAVLTADFAANLVIEQNGKGLYGRSSVGTGSVVRHLISIAGDNVVTVGDAALASELDLVASGPIDLVTGGALSWRFNDSVLDAFGNAIINTLYLEQDGSDPADAGWLRALHNTAVLKGRQNGGSGNRTLINWGAAANALQIGAGGGAAEAVDNLYLDVATGGTIFLRVNGGSEYEFTSTGADWQGNSIFDVNFVQSSGTTSTTGFIRGPNSFGPMISVRGAGAYNVTMVDGVDGSDIVRFGDPIRASALYFDVMTGGGYGFWINSNQELGLDASTLNLFTNSVTNVGFITSSGTVPSSGFLRLQGGDQTIIAVRQTTDRNVMSWSATGPLLTVGGITNDSNFVGEHHVRGLLGSTEVWDFEDTGESHISALNGSNRSTTHLLVRGPGSTGSNNGGGSLYLDGGRRAGTGPPGRVAIRQNIDDSSVNNMLEACTISGRQVLGFLGGANLTSTEVPSGDATIYIRDAFTVPGYGSASDPSEGVQLYNDDTSGKGGLCVRGKTRVFTTLSYAAGLDPTGSASYGVVDHNFHRQVTGATTVLGAGSGSGLSSDVPISTFDLTKLISDGSDAGWIIDVWILAYDTNTGDHQAWTGQALVELDAGTYTVPSSAATNDFLSLTVNFTMTSTSLFTVRVSNEGSDTWLVSCFTEYRSMQP